MDHLAAGHVPVYETPAEQRTVRERCAGRDQPVLAVRDASRGWIVRYDLQHLDRELDDATLQRLRDRVLDCRGIERRADAGSQTERVGPVSGEIHQPTEREARTLASHLSELVFDERNWT